MEASPSTPRDASVATDDGPLVSVAGVTKAYGDNIVLRGIDLDFHPGEVIALAGENGAGKSTLMKILAGLVMPDQGTVHASGARLTTASVHAARQHGIAIVPQELAPVPDMPIWANIFLGREIHTRLNTLDKRAMIDESTRLLRSFDLEVDPRTTMRQLSTATQQLVEIIKCTSTGARVILLDEPTSAISQHEVDQLYRIIQNLQDAGVAMLYTTHKMAEIRAVATRVVVLRDGLLIADEAVDDIDDEAIVTSMIGRELGELYPEFVFPGDSEVVLDIQDLVIEPGGAPISLRVRSGEIVALAGLLGAGRTELLETAFGARRSHGGQTLVSGQRVPPFKPDAAIRSGMALVPEDRKAGGAFLSMSILQNSILPRLSDFSTAGWIAGKRATERVESVMDSVRLKRTGLRQEVGQLSGGNQQKVVIGRWLTGNVRVLLLDEPTRGVDVGARGEIYQLIVNLAREHGIAVLMASSDMTEVIGLAHRIFVMRDGQVVADLDRTEHTDPEALQELIFRHAADIAHSSQENPDVR
ncbi:MAG TPA: sugar ABC transporter ATP-binding protein [Candidatus Stackebrandtia excrementipullorum]|nr:sugar ABC transporter ATP-binding protein [Candidatus Stackebrandtia excrementipullorum]